MSRLPYLDSNGNLVPITNGDLTIPSRPAHVAHYACMYTRVLVRQGLDGKDLNLELFLELHRRARDRFLKDGTLYKWNRGEGMGWDHRSNARLIGAYDEKWGIGRRGGLTYLPDSEDR